MSSAYDISCPDPDCEKQGVIHMSEIESLVGKELTDKHKMFRLNTGRKTVEQSENQSQRNRVVIYRMIRTMGFTHEQELRPQNRARYVLTLINAVREE